MSMNSAQGAVSRPTVTLKRAAVVASEFGIASIKRRTRDAWRIKHIGIPQRSNKTTPAFTSPYLKNTVQCKQSADLGCSQRQIL